MMVWLLRFSLRKEAIDQWKKMIPYKKEWKHTKGGSLGPYFMTLIALYMNSLAPK